MSSPLATMPRLPRLPTSVLCSRLPHTCSTISSSFGAHTISLSRKSPLSEYSTICAAGVGGKRQSRLSKGQLGTFATHGAWCGARGVGCG
eukprot:161239-Chlamydomonas_euryale.AAC.4